MLHLLVTGKAAVNIPAAAVPRSSSKN